MARMGKGREAWAASRARIQQGSVRLPRVAYGLSQSASEWHTQTLSKPASAPRKATARVDLAGPSSLEPSARAPGHSPRGAGLPNSMPTTPPGRTTSAPAATRRGRAQQLEGARGGRFRLAQPLSAQPGTTLARAAHPLTLDGASIDRCRPISRDVCLARARLGHAPPRPAARPPTSVGCVARWRAPCLRRAVLRAATGAWPAMLSTARRSEGRGSLPRRWAPGRVNTGAIRVVRRERIVSSVRSGPPCVAEGATQAASGAKRRWPSLHHKALAAAGFKRTPGRPRSCPRSPAAALLPRAASGPGF